MYKKIGIIVILALFMPFTALAWDDCPYGLVDDPYPGECSRYVDTDEDGLCDHSQLAPEDRNQVIDTGTVTESEIEHEDNRVKLISSFMTVFTFLLAIIIYVQYKKKYD